MPIEPERFAATHAATGRRKSRLDDLTLNGYTENLTVGLSVVAPDGEISVRLSRILRSLCLLPLLVPMAGCVTQAPERSGSLLSRALATPGSNGEADPNMLLLFATVMAKSGSVTTLEEAVKSGEVAARQFAKSRNHKGTFQARMLQADALIQLGREADADLALIQGEAAAQSAECPVCLSEMHTRRGQLESVQHHWDQASSNFDTAVSILESRSEITQAVRIRLYQSALALKAGELTQADRAAAAAEALLRNAPDPRLQGVVHAQFADIRFQQQDFAASADRMERAQVAFGEAGARTEQVTALARLSRIGYATRSPQKARQRLVEADTVARGDPDLGARAREWMLIADAYDRLGDHDAADANFRKAETIYQDTGSTIGLATVEVVQIMTALGEHKFDEVARRAQAARAYLAEKPKSRGKSGINVATLPLNRWQIETSLDVAEGALLLTRGMAQEALGRFENAAKLAQRWNQPGLLGSASSLKGEVHMQLSEFAAAEQAFRIALDAYQRDGNEQGIRKTQALLTRVRLRTNSGS